MPEIDPHAFTAPTANTVRTIGDITLRDDTGAFTYAPAEDLTALEFSKLTVLFLNAITAGPSPIAWRQYVTDNKLERHFKDAA